MGNTCMPVADSFRYMAEPIHYCEVKKKKRLILASAGEHFQQLALLYIAGGSLKWQNQLGKLFSIYIFYIPTILPRFFCHVWM